MIKTLNRLSDERRAGFFRGLRSGSSDGQQFIIDTIELLLREAYSSVPGRFRPNCMRTVGVYALISIKSPDFYIGGSRNIVERLKSHHSLLKNGTHKNTRLQRQFDADGADAFFSVEMFVQEMDCLCCSRWAYFLETFLISKLEPQLNSQKDIDRAKNPKQYIDEFQMAMCRNE